MSEPDERPESPRRPAPRRRRATGGVPPTREVTAMPSRDEVDDWREAGPDDERLTREVPPHW